MSSENTSPVLNLNNCNVILLDIAGTTTSNAFLKDTLFSYVDKQVETFLKESWEKEEVKEAVKILKDEDVNQDAAITLVKELTQKNSDNKGLKTLQGLIYKKGYENGELKAHVFSDVPTALELWAKSRKVAVFSTGSLESQKLLFSHSTEGDLTGHISNYFDQGIGSKTESASYEKISKTLEVKSEEVVFLTDNFEEAKAAKSAGMVVSLVVREGNDALPEEAKKEFPVISTFEDVTEKSVKRKNEEEAPVTEEQPPAKLAKTDNGVKEKDTESPKEETPAVEKIEDEAMEVDTAVEKEEKTEKIQNEKTEEITETKTEVVATKEPTQEDTTEPIIETKTDEKIDPEEEKIETKEEKTDEKEEKIDTKSEKPMETEAEKPTVTESEKPMETETEKPMETESTITEEKTEASETIVSKDSIVEKKEELQKVEETKNDEKTTECIISKETVEIMEETFEQSTSEGVANNRKTETVEPSDIETSVATSVEVVKTTTVTETKIEKTGSQTVIEKITIVEEETTVKEVKDTVHHTHVSEGASTHAIKAAPVPHVVEEKITETKAVSAITEKKAVSAETNKNSENGDDTKLEQSKEDKKSENGENTKPEQSKEESKVEEQSKDDSKIEEQKDEPTNGDVKEVVSEKENKSDLANGVDKESTNGTSTEENDSSEKTESTVEEIKVKKIDDAPPAEITPPVSVEV